MCTSCQLQAQDGSVCVARTMEFPDMLGARLTVVPRGITLKSASADGDGVTWTTTYGVVGMDATGDPQLLTDGMNERGDRKSARLNSRHQCASRMPSSATKKKTKYNT